MYTVANIRLHYTQCTFIRKVFIFITRNWSLCGRCGFTSKNFVSN